jgi:hypothetical protein
MVASSPPSGRPWLAARHREWVGARNAARHRSIDRVDQGTCFRWLRFWSCSASGRCGQAGLPPGTPGLTPADEDEAVGTTASTALGRTCLPSKTRRGHRFGDIADRIDQSSGTASQIRPLTQADPGPGCRREPARLAAGDGSVAAARSALRGVGPELDDRVDHLCGEARQEPGLVRNPSLGHRVGGVDQDVSRLAVQGDLGAVRIGCDDPVESGG